MPGKQTCKEQVDGGGKTCKAPSSCRAQCDDDEYCAADNTCLVRSRDECGNSEDCELLYTNKTLCMGKIKEQSCILPSEKPRGTTCTDEQLWSKSDGCLSPGELKILRKITINFIFRYLCVQRGLHRIQEPPNL